ncbi:MAG: hypothetical protein LH702_05390, partial [Phormidesmis sp. CAN_BIN44]|nr:hypothetical protein [Phormidesmis sp. CAN_BIN44]
MQPRILQIVISVGVAECKYELPSSPTLLPKEKGAKDLVPSPLGLVITNIFFVEKDSSGLIFQ